MAKVDWDLQKYDGEFKAAGMVRVKKAAEIIRDIAKANCKVGTVTRPAYKKYVNAEGKLVARGKEATWTERTPGAMQSTIRVTQIEATKDREVRIYAGNFKAWWAVQMEYGRGGWKGGAKPFMRPALNAAPSAIKSVIENGV